MNELFTPGKKKRFLKNIAHDGKIEKKEAILSYDSLK